MGSPRGSAGRDRGDVAGRANAGQRETGSSPNDPASASVGELVVECARGNEKLRRLVATLLHPNGRRLCPHRRECGCLDHPLGTRGTRSPSSSSPAITRRCWQSGWPRWCKRLWRPGPARLSASTRVRWMRCSAGWSRCVIAPRGMQRSWRARSPVGSTCARNNGTCCSIAATCGPTAKWKCSACWRA